MNTDILKGKWLQLKGNARKRWGKLTDDDLDRVQGNAETFLGMLQEKYGYARDRAERELDEFLMSSSDLEGRHPDDVSRENADIEGAKDKRRRVS